MAETNVFEGPDTKQTLKKLPFDGNLKLAQPCDWTRIEMPATVYISACQCQDSGRKAAQRPLTTLKTVLMTSLTLLAVVLIVQSMRRSQCEESHVTKGVAGFEEENMVAEAGSRRLERDVSPLEAQIDLSQTGSKPKMSPANRKHRHRKSKAKRRKPRSRRSNNSVRSRVRVLTRRLDEYERQISAMNRSMAYNMAGIRNDISNIQSDQRIAVHLTYTYANEDSLVYGAGFFVWTLMPSSPGYDFFRYNEAPNQASGRDIYGVLIEYEGQYLVYSQVLVNGRDTLSFMPHDCAHETVLARNGVIQRTLLKSFITQNDLGLPIGSDNSGSDGDPALRPKDTSFQMGVFHLRYDDEIRIRIPESCTHFQYSGDPQGSYFGVMRL